MTYLFYSLHFLLKQQLRARFQRHVRRGALGLLPRQARALVQLAHDGGETPERKRPPLGPP